MATEPYAKVIADSITEDGHRLTTVEAGGWRPILAEQNTHRVFSRNSASSRAIPVDKTLNRFWAEQMFPASWRAENPGMQGGANLEGRDLQEAKFLWERLSKGVHDTIKEYVDAHPDKSTRLHKSLLNRWLEVGLRQVQIISGTSWDGYYWQRCHEAADDNIRLMAEAIRDAQSKSTPVLLKPGEYHLPYFGEDNGGHADDWDDAEQLSILSSVRITRTEVAKRVSAGRCARVSYMNQAGVRDLQDDLTLYGRLADREFPLWEGNPPHASPLEHIATPWPENSQVVEMPNGKTMGPLPKLGNFVGFWQMRHEELAF